MHLQMSRLLSPLKLGPYRLRNRIAMPPMASETADERGMATDTTVAYYAPRARAGTALIIVEHTYVVPQGRRSRHQLGLYSDDHVAPIRRVAEAIKAEGAVAAIQLTHAGAAADHELIGCAPEAPSEVRPPGRPNAAQPTAMSPARVAEVQGAFVDAAVRAWRAGFQVIELHAAHGYLLNQFFSPLTNLRSDAYGGSMENRLRFSLETVAMVRAALPDDAVVAMRLGADDGFEGGITLEDSVWAAPRLVEAGVGFLDISGGLAGSGRDRFGPDAPAEGYFARLAEAIRRVVDVPVMVTGGIVNPSTADALVGKGVADVIGVGRAMLSDPDWSSRAMRELAAAEL